MKKLLVVPALCFLTSCVGVQRRLDKETATPPTQQTGGKKAAPAKDVKTSSSLKAMPASTTLTPMPSEAAKAVALEKDGKFKDAVKEYVALSVSAPADKKDTYRIKAQTLLEQRLDETDLRVVADDSDYGFLRANALFLLGRAAMDRRDNDAARRYFSSVVSFLPGSDLSQKSEEYLAQLESVKYVEPKTVGVVLPLSGKNESVGQKALRGIALGLGLNEPDSPFKLAVMDSEGNPDKARQGVERLVKEDNVIAIVGSLLSKEASAVATKANELGVPSLGLSQRNGLTDIGPSVFRNALTSEMQVRQLVRAAIDDMNIRRFAILYPNDAYGVEYANLFWDEVLARGGQVTAVQSYNPKETDFRPVAERLVNTFYVEGRADEFKLRLKERSENQTVKKSVRKEESGDDVLPPVVDFDAVFIPDSAKSMGQLAAFLSYAGIRGVKLLGTNLWNSPGLARRAGNFAKDLVFVDGFFNDSDAAKNSKFVADYQKMFNETPSLIEIQAYDSALLLRSLVANGSGTREDLTRRLTDLRRFPGALGFLEMSPNREIRRPLVTLTLRNGEIAPLQTN